MRYKLPFILIPLVCLLTLPVCAKEYGAELIEGFSAILPDTLSGESAEELAAKLSAGNIADMLANELSSLVSPVTKQLCALFGMIILVSVLNAFKSTLTGAGLTSALDYASLLCVATTVYGAVYDSWSRTAEAIDTVSAFMRGLIPLTSALYAAGGSVTAAAVSSGGTLVLTAAVERLSGGVLWPVLRVIFALSVASALSGTVNISGICASLRSLFTWLLALITTLYVAALSYQTNLALAADNTASRAVKFAAGSAIPVVGGALGDAVRAIGGSISLLKTTLGTAAVAVIIIIILPPVLNLLLCRFAFALTGAAAKLLGCERESAFICDVNSLTGLGLALLSCVSLAFIIYVTLFARSACALG